MMMMSASKGAKTPFRVHKMILGSKGASAPFRIHDIVLELAEKHYIMYPEMARSSFDPDIII